MIERREKESCFAAAPADAAAAFSASSSRLHAPQQQNEREEKEIFLPAFIVKSKRANLIYGPLLEGGQINTKQMLNIHVHWLNLLLKIITIIIWSVKVNL